MSQQKATTGSGRLIALFTAAYCVALLIVAAMALASYLLLQEMMAAQQSDERLLALINTQKALSQRVMFLAAAADTATAHEKPALLELAAHRHRRFRERL